MEIGVYHELEIVRERSSGLYLVHEDEEEVLLPNKYCPEKFEIGDKLKVFVYLDHQERKVATTIEPKIKLDEFALLKVAAVNQVGAFMDWGLEKELLCPFREQPVRMEEDRWYVVYLDLDAETDRLFASNRLDNYLQNEQIQCKPGDEVDLVIRKKTDLGYNVIINNDHKGLIFENEIFKEVNIGDKMKGWIKQIREDKKIDVSLQPLGYHLSNDKNTVLILNKLTEADGFLPFSDKSSPEVIYDIFGISKKAFKKSIGALYREKRILIEKDGIRLVVSN